MDRNRDVAEALVEFAQDLYDNRSVEAVLQALGDFSTRLLPIDGAGVLLLEDSELRVATTNSPEGDALEALEAVLHEGPCVDCVRTGLPVFVSDLQKVEGRYPRFVPKAIEAGAAAVHAIPLMGRGEVVGALDIVNRRPVVLSDADLDTAQMLADVAVSYIFAVRLHEESNRLAEQLQTALDARVVIEQAKGILAERHGIDVREAFERLRSHARSNSTTVRSVAEQTVEGRLRL